MTSGSETLANRKLTAHEVMEQLPEAPCEQCQALCCSVFRISKGPVKKNSDGYEYRELMKREGDVCPHLDCTSCGVYDERKKLEYTDCIGYACFGTGALLTDLIETCFTDPSFVRYEPPSKGSPLYPQWERRMRLVDRLFSYVNRILTPLGHARKITKGKSSKIEADIASVSSELKTTFEWVKKELREKKVDENRYLDWSSDVLAEKLIVPMNKALKIEDYALKLAKNGNI